MTDDGRRAHRDGKRGIGGGTRLGTEFEARTQLERRRMAVRSQKPFAVNNNLGGEGHAVVWQVRFLSVFLYILLYYF